MAGNKERLSFMSGEVRRRWSLVRSESGSFLS